MTSKHYIPSPKLKIGINDLASQRTDLSSEWDYEKNGDITPQIVTVNSGVKAWWKCRICGYSWQASIAHRNYGRGCPMCAKTNRSKICSEAKTEKGKNDLLSQRPDIAKEWNYIKNSDLRPDSIAVSSQKKVWWICSVGHEWEASVGSRKRGGACPYCQGRKVLVGFNDLASQNPELASEWNYDRNANIIPEMFTCNSGRKVWWIDSLGHEWQSTITHRNHGSGCPVCSKERKTSFPEQAIFFYVKRIYPSAQNGNVREIGLELDIWIPEIKTAIEYDGLAWHQINKCETRKNDLCRQHGIRLIRIREDGLSELGNCECIIRRDISKPNSLNKCIEILINMIGRHDLERIDVESDSADILNQYVHKRKTNSLAVLRPELLSEWDYVKNGKLNPSLLSAFSNKRVWWKCSKCGNEWNTKVEVRSYGRGCPKCIKEEIPKLISKSRLRIGENDLKTTNPELVDEWNYEKNGDLLPENTSKCNSKKVWWKCRKCNYEWKATVYNRTNNHGCPRCAGRRTIQNEETGEIFETLVDAAKKYNTMPSNIGRVLSGRGKTAGGYHWRYYDSQAIDKNNLDRQIGFSEGDLWPMNI